MRTGLIARSPDCSCITMAPMSVLTTGGAADRILALHRIDLPAAAQLAQQISAGQGGQAPVITVFDPVLLTYARHNGTPEAQLLPTPDLDISHGVTAQVLAATRTVCAAADAVMADLVPAARGAAWCGHWLQYLHFTALGYRRLAQRMLPALAGDTLRVLLPDLPHRFGFHSYLPGLVFSDVMRQAGVAVQLYSAPVPAWDAPLLPDPMSGPGGPDAAVDLLCHLPTCFYDAALFCSEIRAAGRQALVLPAQVFNAPLDGLPTAGMASPDRLAERLDAVTVLRLNSLLPRLAEVLTSHLEPLLPAAGLLQTQVRALVAGYRHNALLYLALAQRFAKVPPATLLLSNHDVGLHGAMLSFARQHGVRTVMVPHAKVYPDPLTSYGHDILCLGHPLQGGDVLDLDSHRMPWAALDFAEPRQSSGGSPKPLATLGIVLNAVSLNSMCLVDVQAYLAGLSRLRDWCSAQGVACRIRCRPNGSVLSLLVDALALTDADLARDQEGSIADFGRQCDLVLGYDVPTSGMLALLDAGVPVLQALCRRLGPQEWRSLDAGVVPQLMLDAVIAQLATYRGDALALWRFGHQQASQCAARTAAALPLRAYL